VARVRSGGARGEHARGIQPCLGEASATSHRWLSAPRRDTGSGGRLEGRPLGRRRRGTDGAEGPGASLRDVPLRRHLGRDRPQPDA
jgi:hypothetical protein